jgi:hypothetical protein
MPDTGAPWNIPYVDPTDLVRDYPQASEDLADAIADGLDAAGNPGIGSNVVATTKTDEFTTTSTTFTAITGLTATITPSSNTSKVLVLVNLGYVDVNSNTRPAHVRLMRGATAIAIGDASDTSIRTTMTWKTTINSGSPGGIAFIDSPATDLAVTYSLEVRTDSATPTVSINRSGSATGDLDGRTVSSITLIEVAP